MLTEEVDNTVTTVEVASPPVPSPPPAAVHTPKPTPTPAPSSVVVKKIITTAATVANNITISTSNSSATTINRNINNTNNVLANIGRHQVLQLKSANGKILQLKPVTVAGGNGSLQSVFSVVNGTRLVNGNLVTNSSNGGKTSYIIKVVRPPGATTTTATTALPMTVVSNQNKGNHVIVTTASGGLTTSSSTVMSPAPTLVYANGQAGMKPIIIRTTQSQLQAQKKVFLQAPLNTYARLQQPTPAMNPRIVQVQQPRVTAVRAQAAPITAKATTAKQALPTATSLIGANTSSIATGRRISAKPKSNPNSRPGSPNSGGKAATSKAADSAKSLEDQADRAIMLEEVKRLLEDQEDEELTNLETFADYMPAKCKCLNLLFNFQFLI